MPCLTKVSPVQKDCADFLKALGDPIRLRIVYCLFEREACVSDLAQALNLSQPHVSHHLKILKTAHIVDNHRDQHKVYYRLTSRIRTKFSRRDKSINLKCCSIRFKG